MELAFIHASARVDNVLFYYFGLLVYLELHNSLTSYLFEHVCVNDFPSDVTKIPVILESSTEGNDVWMCSEPGLEEKITIAHIQETGHLQEDRRE